MKILTLDIETAPTKAYIWRLFKENISIEQILEAGGLMCFAAKWLGKSGTLYFDGEDMVDQAHELLCEADALVTFNGNSFDIPILNTEFVKAGLFPPDSYKSIDLYQTVKRRFRFTSSKLDFVSRELGLGRKTQHEGFLLWKKCLEGDYKAWEKMEKYNRQDVVLTEKLYRKLLPWIVNHPANGLYDSSDKPVCKCGSTNIAKNGLEILSAGVYQRYRCQSCGAPLRGRTMLNTQEERKSILVPTL